MQGINMYTLFPCVHAQLILKLHINRLCMPGFGLSKLLLKFVLGTPLMVLDNIVLLQFDHGNRLYKSICCVHKVLVGSCCSACVHAWMMYGVSSHGACFSSLSS